MVPTDPPRDLAYMRSKGLLEDTVYCETCFEQAKYIITGSHDVNAEVRMKLKEDVNQANTFKPYYNSSGNKNFYKFLELQEEVKQHADLCDPDLRERRSNRDRRNL